MSSTATSLFFLLLKSPFQSLHVFISTSNELRTSLGRSAKSFFTFPVLSFSPSVHPSSLYKQPSADSRLYCTPFPSPSPPLLSSAKVAQSNLSCSLATLQAALASLSLFKRFLQDCSGRQALITVLNSIS